ncbi:4806_t:CDS:2 [Gigaspora rosea]|nr:4806_t:CDS:2 [Gigaspora rosea]
MLETQKQINLLQVEKQDLKSQLQSKQVLALQEKVEILEPELQTQKQINLLQVEKQDLKSQLQVTQKELTFINNQLVNFQTSFKISQSKYWQLQEKQLSDKANTEKEKLEAEIIRLNKELEQKKEKKKQLKVDLQLQGNKLNNLEKLISLDQKLIRQLKAKQEQVKEIKKQLNNQLAYKKYNTISLHNDLQKQEQELKKIDSELKDIQKKDLNLIQDYLGVKKIFLNARQITIYRLQNCYDILRSKHKKNAKVDEISNLISAIGGVADSLTFGIPKTCKPFSAHDEMEKAIISLNNNFEKLNAELEQEENQFKEFIQTQNQNTL